MDYLRTLFISTIMVGFLIAKRHSIHMVCVMMKIKKSFGIGVILPIVTNKKEKSNSISKFHLMQLSNNIDIQIS